MNIIKYKVALVFNLLHHFILNRNYASNFFLLEYLALKLHSHIHNFIHFILLLIFISIHNLGQHTMGECVMQEKDKGIDSWWWK